MPVYIVYLVCIWVGMSEGFSLSFAAAAEHLSIAYYFYVFFRV